MKTQNKGKSKIDFLWIFILRWRQTVLAAKVRLAELVLRHSEAPTPLLRRQREGPTSLRLRRSGPLQVFGLQARRGLLQVISSSKVWSDGTESVTCFHIYFEWQPKNVECVFVDHFRPSISSIVKPRIDSIGEVQVFSNKYLSNLSSKHYSLENNVWLKKWNDFCLNQKVEVIT